MILKKNILKWQNPGFTGFQAGGNYFPQPSWFHGILRRCGNDFEKNILELQKPGFAAPLSIIPCLPFCSLPTISCRTTTRISEEQRWKKMKKKINSSIFYTTRNYEDHRWQENKENDNIVLHCRTTTRIPNDHQWIKVENKCKTIDFLQNSQGLWDILC